MNYFRQLSPEEAIEFRQWARDNFSPKTDKIMYGVWHPEVCHECEVMLTEQIV